MDDGGPFAAMNKQGKMQKINGKRIFTGTFWACSSARCERLIRISRAWTRSTLAIGMPNASACTIADANCSQVGQVGAIAHGADGLGPADPDLHLLQDAEELAGQRPLAVASHLGEGAVEGESRLDRDRQQVEGVGQLRRIRSVRS